MDKENGKSNNESSSGSNKHANAQDSAALLDAASLFGAYWPRGDANSAQAANLFAAAAAGGFGLQPHPSMPFGMLPPASSSSRGGGGMSSSYPASSVAAAAYNNAYTNTLSVAASQAASLGMPAASAAWWSMASHLAAQDYLARLQASGLNFPSLGNPADPYSALGIPQHSSHHKSSSGSSKNSKSLSRSSSGGSNKDKLSSTATSSSASMNSKMSASLSMAMSGGGSKNHPLKYSSSLTIQPSTMKLPPSSNHSERSKKTSDLLYNKHDKSGSSGGYGNSHNKSSTLGSTSSSNSSSALSSSICATVKTSSPSPSIFTSPLSLASNAMDGSGGGKSGGGGLN